MSGQRDASDTTARRMQRTVYADKVLQTTGLSAKFKNSLVLEGSPTLRGAMDYKFYPRMVQGATETTVAEQDSYVASVLTHNK
jgi:hypothetical protein